MPSVSCPRPQPLPFLGILIHSAAAHTYNLVLVFLLEAPYPKQARSTGEVESVPPGAALNSAAGAGG